MIYTSKLRDFNKKTFLINEVYPSYRAGGVEVNGKFKFRTFYEFPIDEREVVLTGEVEKNNEAKKELREKFWNKEQKRFEFHKVKDKIDREFFKTYKKVFDARVLFENPVEVTNWKGETEESNEVVFQQVGASKIKNILTVVAEVEPPLVEGKDKTGKPAMVPAFDWEDSFREKCKGLFVKMLVSGEGMDTKYNFTPGKEFKVEEINPEDVPF